MRDPFFYEPLVNQLMHPAAQPAVHLWGGYALGKSTVLVALHERLLGRSTSIILGGAPDSVAHLEEAVAQNRFPILIDDLDAMLRPETITQLDRLAPHLARNRVIFTSTIPPHLGLLAERGVIETKLSAEEVQVWSSVTLQFDSRLIDPWMGDWRRRIGQLMLSVLPGKPGKSLDERRRAWAAVIMQLTGGHPMLLDVACSELRTLASTDEIEAYGTGTATEDRRSMYRRLEDSLFRTGLRNLRRVYSDLRERSPAAFKSLSALALGEIVDTGADVRDILLWSGLVAPTERGLMVAGELLQRALANGSDNEHLRLQRGALDEPRGLARLMIGGAWKNVDLRGAAWLILEVLHANRDRVLSVNELMSLTKFENEAAFRSALQRLRSEFLEVGADGVIENIWGQGYSVAKQPLLVLPETPVREKSAQR